MLDLELSFPATGLNINNILLGFSAHVIWDISFIIPSIEGATNCNYNLIPVLKNNQDLLHIFIYN